MSSHLKQAIHKLNKAMEDLSTQETGDDDKDLAKAQCLDIVFYEVKEMLGHAIDTIPTYTPDHTEDATFVYLKHKIEDIHEDDELKDFIKKLEEATYSEEDRKADEDDRNYAYSIRHGG